MPAHHLCHLRHHRLSPPLLLGLVGELSSNRGITMIKIYPVIFHTETNGSYWGEFPDFAGGTQDDNLEEAKRNAKEFLSGVHVEFVEV